MTETCFVFGGAGFIGHHLARRLRSEGKFVVVFDIKERNEFCESSTYCDEYVQVDLSRDLELIKRYLLKYNPTEVYQLACMMGGAGFIFVGSNDFEIMVNSISINSNLLKAIADLNMFKKIKVFFSSSACVYPQHNQEDPEKMTCEESTAYPAFPDSEYGWEKLMGERLLLTANRTKGLEVRVARFHNIYGPEGTYEGGKEKVPAALCRKIASTRDGGTIEIWGPGVQTRSFLHVKECIEGIRRLMNSSFLGPVNIGSTEMISINDFARMIIKISGKNLNIKNINGPLGVLARNSHNELIKNKLGWEPKLPLLAGITETYAWINNLVSKGR